MKMFTSFIMMIYFSMILTFEAAKGRATFANELTKNSNSSEIRVKNYGQ